MFTLSIKAFESPVGVQIPKAGLSLTFSLGVRNYGCSCLSIECQHTSLSSPYLPHFTESYRSSECFHVTAVGAHVQSWGNVLNANKCQAAMGKAAVGAAREGGAARSQLGHHTSQVPPARICQECNSAETSRWNCGFQERVLQRRDLLLFLSLKR